MIGFQERYINLFTGYGFQRLFVEKSNKDLLLDFLNTFLKEKEGQIISIFYLDNEDESVPYLKSNEGICILCVNQKKQKIIVEFQIQNHPIGNTVIDFYRSISSIEKQISRSKLTIESTTLYTIVLTDFVFKENRKDGTQYLYTQEIDFGANFENNMCFTYVELPKFIKNTNELTTDLDKWLFVIKNLHNLDKRPSTHDEIIFQKLFSVADLRTMTNQDWQYYETSMKHYRDLNNVHNYQFEKGFEEGIKMAQEEVKKSQFEKGYKEGVKTAQEEIKKRVSNKRIIDELLKTLSIEKITSLTGLTELEILRIQGTKDGND
ncbi:MAG: Rpn family recombination-promoting nuclease/putative transposase [Flavobacteriales bacterium]|nr:Rpn family recombination-promoting nuclease/putative transposase [Flavobacteriales bacterium]